MAEKQRTFPTYKTKRVLSGAQTLYRAWKDWDEGDVIIARLKGTSVNRKNRNKKDWIVEVEDVFFSDKKAEKKYKGQTLTLNTAGQLDKGMEQIENGALAQITYNGSKEMQGGDYEGQMAHLMEVVEVEEANSKPSKKAKATDYEEDEEDEDDIDDEEDEDEDDL